MRRNLSRALVALPVSVAALAVVAVAPPSFASASPTSTHGGAVFVQTDDLVHNSIVAFNRDDAEISIGSASSSPAVAEGSNRASRWTRSPRRTP